MWQEDDDKMWETRMIFGCDQVLFPYQGINQKIEHKNISTEPQH